MSLWFRNLHIYRFVDGFSLSQEALEEKLANHRFQSCARQAKESIGWISPLHRHFDELTYEAHGCLLLCMRKEEKVIPASAVNEALEERVAEVEEQQGRQVFKKEKQQLKEDILALMLPKAFTRATHCFAYIDTKNGFLIVNAGSNSLADTFISLLIESVGQLGAAKIAGDENPATIMNLWLKDELPEGWSLTGEYELKDPADERVARFRDNEAENLVIGDLLDDGYWVNKLGIQYQDELKAVIQHDLQIKSVKFDDELVKENEDIDSEDKMARWDADFVLMTRTLAGFVEALLAEFQVGDTVEA
ncbi:recombination-associated protein RdgC [Pleionea sp. CnH1-48]|uniref:recombination-associated protein RdgC n=1 Tax=Pleionea sp. CnH1-48 TaxID=2954494 RepID=UPI002097F674|nr:recombination-associated protein RdgC [Pleionea sp. CnH1-48]MCO7223134.1 recombination-associated protein RdgC [Pleionea sp. CnH1-48]